MAFTVTLGGGGSLGVDYDRKINKTPIFSHPSDRYYWCGRCFFCFHCTLFCPWVAPLGLVSFLGNAVGALAVQIVCNKRPAEKNELLEFINTLVK